MTPSQPQAIANTETQHNRMWRVAAIIVFFLMLGFTGRHVYAHNPHDPVYALGISPNFASDQTLFVATDGELTEWRYPDILKSTDGGTNWVKLAQGMDNRFKFSAIRVSPNFSNDHTVFATTQGDGVYQSIDQGNSWQLFNTGLPNLDVRELKIARTGGANYILFLSTGNGALYQRSSAQTKWTRMLAPLLGMSVISVSPDFAQDNTVIIASTSGNLKISSNRGQSWVDKGNPTGALIYDIAIAPGNAREIFIATSNGIFYSDDSGNTFTRKSGNLPVETTHNVAVSPNYSIDHTVFCTTATQAVYKSADGGNSWTLYSAGAVVVGQTTALNEFSELQVSHTFSTDQAVFLSAFDGLFISTNGGTVWTQKQTRKNLTTGLAFSPHFQDDRRVLATTYFGGGFYTSADSGATWTVSPRTGWKTIVDPSAVTAFDVNFIQNHTGAPIAVATRNNVKLGFSSDFAASWNVLTIPKFTDIAPGEVYTNVFGLSPNFDTDQEIYLGTRSHGILQTVDGGISWRTQRGVPTSTNISSVAVSPNYASDKTAFSANIKGEVWRTIDGGESWSRIGISSIVSRSGTKYIWIAISPQFATDRLILVGTNNGIYHSINGGDNWIPLSNQEIGPSTVIQQIEFSPNFGDDRTVFVTVRGKGMYRLYFDNTGWITSTQNVGAWLLNRNIQFTEFRISPNFAQDATLIGASRTNVYLSTNGGLTWTETGHPGQ